MNPHLQVRYARTAEEGAEVARAERQVCRREIARGKEGEGGGGGGGFLSRAVALPVAAS